MDSPWLYIVLAGIVLIVYSRLLPKASSSEPAAAVHQDLDQTIEEFANQIEQENQELVHMISNMRQYYEEQMTRQMKRIDLLEQQIKTLQQKSYEHNHIINTDNLSSTVNVLTPTTSDSQQEVKRDLRDRYDQLFQLYDSGRSMDYIAKKLNMNRGEISLILQLAKQEDRANA